MGIHCYPLFQMSNFMQRQHDVILVATSVLSFEEVLRPPAHTPNPDPNPNPNSNPDPNTPNSNPDPDTLTLSLILTSTLALTLTLALMLRCCDPSLRTTFAESCSWTCST